MNHFTPQISVPLSAIQPDIYTGSYLERPRADFVVARTKDGEPLSFYGDNVWDFSPYKPFGSTPKLVLSPWNYSLLDAVQESLVAQIKYLLFCLIWLCKKRPTSQGTLNNYLSILRKLALFCYENKTESLSVLLSSPQHLSAFFCKHRKQHTLTTTVSLINSLRSLDAAEIGCELPTKTDTRKLMNAISSAGVNAVRKYPVIPARIYTELLMNLENEMNEFDSISDDFLRLAKFCSKSQTYGRRYINKSPVWKKENIGPPPPNITDLVIPYNANISVVDIKDIARTLGEQQAVCQTLIIAYTGMRLGECCSLPYDCVESFYQDGREHYFLRGWTTKNSHGIPRMTKWVTNAAARSAVETSRKIADLLLSEADIPLSIEGEKPLFPSVAHLKLGVGSTLRSNKDRAPNKSLSRFTELNKRILPIIDQNCLNEVHLIDPASGFLTIPEYQSGKPWPLTAHQLRRSLAVYASRSGLVSLPSLRRQLQHITEEMTRYYTAGSAFAKNFAQRNSGHFLFEYVSTQWESAALSYVSNVLLSDEPLFGVHGKWLSNNEGRNCSALLKERETTFQKFKRGEIAYTETALGGCVKVGACNARAMRTLSSCLKCESYVGKGSKIDNVIRAQDHFVSSLEPSSLEWRTEMAELDNLKQFQRIISRSE